MDNINIKDLISTGYTEQCFHVNLHKISRRLGDVEGNIFTPKLYKTKEFSRWKIQEDNLIKLSDNGIFYSGDSYIVQWIFDLKVDDTTVEEMLVYYWKGEQAAKGYSPLPSELTENCPVERIVQWSEPPLFFYSIPTPFVVFGGNAENFNVNVPHLLLIRGELFKEIHLYEVPCKKENLRSRASYLLIDVKNKLFTYWHGKQTTVGHRNNIKLGKFDDYLRTYKELWKNYSTRELMEGHETEKFLKTVEGDIIDYHSIDFKCDWSPKLFYLNSITGNFLATQVEYPLRSGEVAPFTFLKSHLYTATQPALFLLDNNTEVWLWEGFEPEFYDEQTFKEELRLANDLLIEYAKEKEKIVGAPVTRYHVRAYQEPKEFKNLFPSWQN